MLKNDTPRLVNIYNKYFLDSKIKYPKSSLNIPNSPKFLKIVVFDLDETLGSFHEAGILWKIIESELQSDFNILMDIYPEFLRYGIIKILDFILNKKRSGKCDKLYLYTNNINSPEFPKLISGYLKYKLNIEDDIFDKIIGAFKVNNKIIEKGRTSHKKSYSDLINCAILHENVKICFLDDKYYPKMENEKIYYIQPFPYYHTLSNNEIMQRFANSIFNDGIKFEKLNSILNIPDIIHDAYENNREHKIYKKIMYYLKEFFYLTNKNEKTRKIRIPIGKFTRKKNYRFS
jgi:hypothetical protein